MRLDSVSFASNCGQPHPTCQLNGLGVEAINADLTAGGKDGNDLTQAKGLAENAGVSFIGTQKNGPFDVPGAQAREWLSLPNPNGFSNQIIVRPWANGMDLIRRASDTWIVDFGSDRTEAEASLFEAPFAYIYDRVKTIRTSRDPSVKWWLLHRPRPELKGAIRKLPRFIATSMVAKHRVFVWLPVCQVPENLCVAIARSDDTTFGILHSRFHELWSLRLGTSLEDRPRYTPTTCFETFPFPTGLTPCDTAGWVAVGPISKARPYEGLPSPNPPSETHATTDKATQTHANNIAAAAQHLNQLRENWLNPAEWVDWEITPEEEKANFPKRPVAKPGHEADLKKRTLTNLYNARPAWLDLAHKELDKAVAAAYGWTDYTVNMPDEEILRRLLALNLERSRSAHIE